MRNEEVLHRVKEERNMLHTIKRRKANWIYLRGEGPRSRCYGRTTALGLFVQPYEEDKQFFLPSFTPNGAPVE
jgi:hypothetical protein